jgi:hypothetical protein
MPPDPLPPKLFAQLHQNRPPDPMTSKWLIAEIERIGLEELGADQWGGEYEFILAALRSGSAHRSVA